MNNFDPIEKPEHYAKYTIECIDVILQNTKHLGGDQGYLLGNIMKYLWRFNDKGNPIQDLNKAKWYLDKLLQSVKNNT